MLACKASQQGETVVAQNMKYLKYFPRDPALVLDPFIFQSLVPGIKKNMAENIPIIFHDC